MKKITCTFLSLLLITPCIANIHINPDTVTEVIATHFPNKQIECIYEYNEQLKAANGAGISASKLWDVCIAGGLDIKQSEDKEKCITFVNDLVHKGTVKFYETCGKAKNMAGAVCVNDFIDITVNMQQAEGLAKLYALSKFDDTIQCKTTPRMEVYTTTSINSMGMSFTSSIPYLQCTSYNSNKFYEFRFYNVDGNVDAINHTNFKTGICRIFESKFTQEYLYGYKWNICSDITEETTCNEIAKIVDKSNIGYTVSWGPSGYILNDRGYQIDSASLPHCVINEIVAKDDDGYILFENTAFGLNGRVFLEAGIQRKGSNEIKAQILSYVENTMGKENIKSFSCEDTYHTIKLKDRDGTDDMLRCTINDQIVEFFFDDLSESWGKYDESGREAMNCIAWGGTFTGKKCIGLDKKMCDTVRNANAQQCPECKLIQWNEKTKICELPASASATNLKKGLNYTALVGGTLVGVVITIGTMGAASAPTTLILTGLAVETLGAGIELVSQIKIDNTADKFFTLSSNCYDENCAQDLILEYLKTMSNQQNDMLEEELSAADAEMARLAELIPAESDFYQKLFNNGTDLENNETGEWTSDQVWRAIGIGLQLIPVFTGVGKWVINKSPVLQKKLSRTTLVLGEKSKTRKILKNAQKVRVANVVNYENLDDVGKEWYALWKEYAPRNQTFEEFKAMTNGNLDEMKQISRDWIPRSKRNIITESIDKQLDDLNRGFETLENLMDKYNIDAIPEDPNELLQLYEKYPDLEQAEKNLDYIRTQKTRLEEAKAYYTNTSYSTYDPKFAETMSPQKEIDKLIQEYEELRNMPKNSATEQRITEIGEELITLRRATPNQWEIAEQFQLKNLENVIEEHSKEFTDIIENTPEIKSKLNKKTWSNLSDQDRANVVQQILDEYAKRTGTPFTDVYLDYNTPWGGYYTDGDIVLNPNAQLKHTKESIKDITSHEYSHLIDEKVPNEGALGEQYSYYAEKIYSNKPEDGYRVALTEQSSFAIGDAMGRKTEKTLDEYATYGLGSIGLGTYTAIVAKGINDLIIAPLIDNDSIDNLTNNKEKSDDQKK